MEAAATAMIHSQTHLSLQSYYSHQEDDDDGSSSSGELLRGGRGGTPSSGSSYGDFVAILPAGGDAGGGAPPLPPSSKPPHPPRRGSGRGGGWTIDEHAAADANNNFHVWTTDEHAAEAYFLVSATPGYVSFEDLIGGAALYRDGSGRPLEAAINDPLLRSTSRLYAREDGREARRQPSPGPLGTRRGSTMHAIVKKYVCPLQGFLAGIFLCCIIPRDPSTTTETNGLKTTTETNGLI